LSMIAVRVYGAPHKRRQSVPYDRKFKAIRRGF
jgi:hypothetical protein